MLGTEAAIGRRDIVFLPVSDTFADAQKRGFYATADQALLSLIATDSVRKILVVDYPRGIASQIRRRALGDRPATSSGKLCGTRPVVLKTVNPSSERALIRRFRWMDLQVQAASRRFGLVNPLLLSFNLFYTAFGYSSWCDSSVFYAQDDERAIPRLDAWLPWVNSAYERIPHNVNHLIAVTAELGSSVFPDHNCTVIPNGVDDALWRTVPARPLRTAGSDLQAIYVGTVDSRLDVGALISLSRAGIDLKIAGPVAQQAILNELTAEPGVEYLGVLDRAAIVQQLILADVCVLAHVETPLTRAMSPLKLFEYVASGTPVVATDLPGVREASLDIEMVSVNGDYVSAVRSAVSRGRLHTDERKRLVSAISWRNRHDSLTELILQDRTSLSCSH